MEQGMRRGASAVRSQGAVSARAPERATPRLVSRAPHRARPNQLLERSRWMSVRIRSIIQVSTAVSVLSVLAVLSPVIAPADAAGRSDDEQARHLFVANQEGNTIRALGANSKDLGDFATTGLVGP